MQDGWSIEIKAGICLRFAKDILNDDTDITNIKEYFASGDKFVELLRAVTKDKHISSEEEELLKPFIIENKEELHQEKRKRAVNYIILINEKTPGAHLIDDYDSFLNAIDPTSDSCVTPIIRFIEGVAKIGNISLTKYFDSEKTTEVTKLVNDHLNERVISLLCIGETGCGKSTFLNSIIPQSATPYFPINNSGTSKTNACKDVYVGQLLSRELYCYIDTPGLFDTRGQDQDETNLKNIVKFLRQRQILVNMIAFCIDSNLTRMTRTVMSTLSIIFQMADADILNHLCIISLRPQHQTNSTGFLFDNTVKCMKTLTGINDLSIPHLYQQRNCLSQLNKLLIQVKDPLDTANFTIPGPEFHYQTSLKKEPISITFNSIKDKYIVHTYVKEKKKENVPVIFKSHSQESTSFFKRLRRQHENISVPIVYNQQIQEVFHDNKEPYRFPQITCGFITNIQKDAYRHSDYYYKLMDQDVSVCFRSTYTIFEPAWFCINGLYEIIPMDNERSYARLTHFQSQFQKNGFYVFLQDLTVYFIIGPDCIQRTVDSGMQFISVIRNDIPDSKQEQMKSINEFFAKINHRFTNHYAVNIKGYDKTQEKIQVDWINPQNSDIVPQNIKIMTLNKEELLDITQARFSNNDIVVIEGNDDAVYCMIPGSGVSKDERERNLQEVEQIIAETVIKAESHKKDGSNFPKIFVPFYFDYPHPALIINFPDLFPMRISE